MKKCKWNLSRKCTAIACIDKNRPCQAKKKGIPQFIQYAMVRGYNYNEK